VRLRVLRPGRDLRLRERDGTLDVPAELGVSLRRRLRKVDARSRKRSEIVIHRHRAAAKQNVEEEHAGERTVRSGVVRRQRHGFAEQLDRRVVIEVVGEVERLQPQRRCGLRRGGRAETGG
jgi:hypothetical protein